MKDKNRRPRRKGWTPTGNTVVDDYYERTRELPGLRALKPRHPDSKPLLRHEDIEPKQETRRDGVAEARMVPKLRGRKRTSRPSWVVSLAARMNPENRGKRVKRALPYDTKYYPAKALAS